MEQAGDNVEGNRIGWIGTGVMGQAMCGHLLDAGYQLSVFNRTRSKAEPLVKRGAVYAESPAKVAATSDIIFTIVGYPEDVRDVILGEYGLLSSAKPGSIIVDMTTSQPSLAVEIAQLAKAQGVDSIDAPVSGGDVGAQEARLSIMVGGEEAAVQRVWPLLEKMGKTIVHQGGPGRGQHTKMVNQTLIASNMVGVCEALLYAQSAGLDIETVLRSVSSGAAGSWSLSNLAPRMLQGDFEPGFYVEHFIKDIKIAIDESNRMGLILPGLSLARMLYETLRSYGHGKAGTQALILALAEINDQKWPATH